MSKPERESIASKLRPIEIALDNFKARMQGSFNSQLSNLKSKVDCIDSRLPSSTKTSTIQPSGVDFRGVVGEIKSFVQKDLLQDSAQLLNEKLVEFQGLISRVKTVIAEAGEAQAEATGKQTSYIQQSRPGSSVAASGAISDEKDREIASLREEINRLYNLTEREPRFQPFWILRDAYPSWLQITKIARTLGATPSDLHEKLRTFENLGLVEIREGEARATKLVRPNKPMADR